MRDQEFAEYVERRSGSLRSGAFLLCGNWHDAEDLVQTALLRLYRVWDRVHGVDALDAYVRAIVVRAFLDEKRRPWRRERAMTALPETPDRPPDIEERLVVQAALATVPPGQRAVLVLRFWEDLSVEQTAAILGISVGTVKSQTQDGRATLRAALAGTGLRGRL